MERDGYLYDPVTDYRSGGYDRTAAKLKLMSQPTDDLTIRLSGTYLKDHAPWGNLISDRSLPPLGWQVNLQNPLNPVDTASQFQDSVWKSHYVRQPRSDLKARSGTLDIRYDTAIGEFASLTNISTSELDMRVSADMSTAGLGDSVVWQKDDRWSQEFRLTGGEGRFNWQAGVYYLDDSLDAGGKDGQFNEQHPVLTFYPGSVGYDLGNFSDVYVPSETNTTTKAVFAQVGFDITEQLNATLGLRYSKDKIDGTAGFFYRLKTGLVLPILQPYYRSADFDAVTGNLVISYNFTETMMAYASYGRGNSPGGLNSGASAAAVATPFDEQNVDAYEIGLKSQWLDQRLRFNMALYDNEYSDLQLAQVREVAIPGQPGQTALVSVFTNAAESYGRGVELNLEAAVTENWSIGGFYAYLDSKISKYFPPEAIPGAPEPLDLTDAEVVQSPKHTAAASLTYSNSWGPGTLTLTGDVRYTSGYASDYIGATAGTPYPGRPGVPPGVTTDQVIWQIPLKARTVVDLRGNYAWGDWMVSGYVRNLFNQEYLATGAAANPMTLANLVPGEPRTYEISVRRSF